VYVLCFYVCVCGVCVVCVYVSSSVCVVCLYCVCGVYICVYVWSLFVCMCLFLCVFRAMSDWFFKYFYLQACSTTVE